jgi:dihydroxyacid dehydratase/phosphogluconate dehydratase
MNTNAVPVIEHIAQQAGVHLSAEQVSLIMAGGAALIRWIPLEVKAIKAAGGIKNIFAGIWNNPQPPKQ